MAQNQPMSLFYYFDCHNLHVTKKLLPGEQKIGLNSLNLLKSEKAAERLQLMRFVESISFQILRMKALN